MQADQLHVVLGGEQAHDPRHGAPLSGSTSPPAG
jgi:hypothetical protein